MRARAAIACSFLLMSAAALVLGQGAPTAPPPAFPPQTISLPTFTSNATVAGTNYTYTLLGNDPAKGGTTTIPTVLAAIKLTIEARMDAAGRKAVLDAGPVANQVIASPIFADYQFASGTTQYADAIMRADFHQQGGSGDWHTRLGQPKVLTVNIDVPVGLGYVLTSKKTGRMLAMVDLRFMQQELFKQLPKDAVAAGTLLVAVARDTTYYVNADATQCCHWGTYGVDTSAGARQPFVLGTLSGSERGGCGRRRPADCPAAGAILPGSAARPAVPRCSRGARPGQRLSGVDEGARPDHFGTTAPEQWGRRHRHRERRERSDRHELEECGAGVDAVRGRCRRCLLPPAKRRAAAVVQPGDFSDLAQPRVQLSGRERASRSGQTGASRPARRRRVWRGHGSRGGRREAGGHGGNDRRTERAQVDRLLVWYGPIRDVSPQWDVILVAFATPDHNAGEGQMQYRVNGNMTPEEFKADIKLKQSQGKKVMISLGGGGQRFTLETEADKQRFIKSVEAICSEFGFDGIDIDFETPSLELSPGETDPKHPTTASTVNLIAAMREIHDHFGPSFMLSLVPEGSQTPAGYPGYGGQFGSYLPLLEGIRDILAFTDTQDYNCPPIQGLDGEYDMPGSVDYHAAATELFLHGFDVGRDPKHHFAALPPEKVIVGYLNSDTTPQIVAESMRMLTTGRSSLPTTYRMQKPAGYPTFSGAMFWTIDADRREEYRYSNVVGPLLHGLPKK